VYSFFRERFTNQFLTFFLFLFFFLSTPPPHFLSIFSVFYEKILKEVTIRTPTNHHYAKVASLEDTLEQLILAVTHVNMGDFKM
jgi:hypothetical protein